MSNIEREIVSTNNHSQSGTALEDPTFKSEKILAITAARDFQMYGEPGYDDNLINALKKAQSSREIRDLLRKARAAS